MKRYLVLIISFLLIIISCIALYNDYCEDKNASGTYSSLSDIVEDSSENYEINIVDKSSDEYSSTDVVLEQESTEVLTILPKFEELYTENNDLVGWIYDNNLINYPIMQCEEDSNFYLHKDFYKNESKEGSIYIPNDITIDDKLVMIYGHNMKNNSMFGSLDYYLDETYFNEHKYIELSSLYNDKRYEVLAVFVSKVFPDDYQGFKYYDYRGNITEDEFNVYKSEIRQLIEIGNIDSLSYNDNIIELITCWYSEKDARLVVLCKEIL